MDEDKDGEGGNLTKKSIRKMREFERERKKERKVDDIPTMDSKSARAK